MKEILPLAPMENYPVRTHFLLNICVLLLSAYSFACWSRRGHLIGQWETKNEAFKVRISEYTEKGVIFLPGAYYAFESTPLNSNRWQQVMTIRYDNQVPIPKKQVRFLDQQTGYAFIGAMFAVTRDGGSTWKVWDAAKDWSDWRCRNHSWISEVNIATDGKGLMKLNSYSQCRGEVYSRDFGQSWSVK